MACDTQAGLEAQKLISISLGKMAASRVGRTGASLHKSLLVASVLHRARHVVLESYHVHRAAHPEAYATTPTAAQVTGAPLVAVYAPLLPSPVPEAPEAPAEESAEAEDKENRVSDHHQEPEPSPEPPQPAEPCSEAPRNPLAESNSNTPNTSPSKNSRSASLKRRRCVSQQETQEAVLSILPKRPRTSPSTDPAPDHHSLQQQALQTQQQQSDASNSMEVEHITSLVSIFSFGGQRVDMCGTEAAREDVAQFQPVALAV